MRILHIIGTLDPAAGGPTESVRLLLSYGLIGYAGEVVTLDDPNSPYLLDLPFTVHALGPQITKYGFTRKLHRWLLSNRDRFDGVVVNGLWQYCGLAACMTLGFKVPYVVFTHGMLDPWFKHRYPLKHVKKWIYWIFAEYWVLRGAYRVLFTSEEESRLAETSFWLHRWEGMVVPYGSSQAPHDKQTSTQAFFEVCPAVLGRSFIVFLGRIHKKKGCDHLIEAFARVAHINPELHLVIAGPDQQGWSAELQVEAAKAGLRERIHWPGMLYGKAKWGALLASDAFILPSHQENFGIAVAEALACSCPVLLSDKVNIARVIESANAGLVESDSVMGTESLLRRWLKLSVIERQEMATRARACFETHFDMRRNAESLVRLFELATPRAGA